MPRFLVLLAMLASHASGAWHEFKSGPFTVISDRGENQSREVLAELEQFRGALGQAVGKTDLKTVWPVTVVVGRGAAADSFLGMGRDGWMAYWPERGRPAAGWFRKMALLFLEDNLPGQMDLDFENALADAYSTLRIEGSRLTFGDPPPAASRTWQWALIHKFTVDEGTRGRVRVLLSNLANGGEFDVSLRNAFQQTQQEVEKQARDWAARAEFDTAAWTGFGINPDRFRGLEALPSRVRLIAGDLALARGQYAQAVSAYEKAQAERASTAGDEGLGLALAGLKRNAQALEKLRAIAADETAGARGLYELARLEPGKEEARMAVERASLKKPDWADPYILAAGQEPGPVRRAFLLKKAVELAPRRIELWELLAAAQSDAQQFDEAAKSWRAAMRAAGSSQERERLLERQRAAETARLDVAEAARKKRELEDRDEVDRLKREAEARIRAAERNANQAAGELKSKEKPQDWWDGPPLEKAEGRLVRVECVRRTLRLVIDQGGGKTLRLLVSDPGRLGVLGAAETTLACGALRQPRAVKAEYRPKRDATSATAGEAVTLEFQ